MPISVLSGQSWASGQLRTTGEGLLSGEEVTESLRHLSLSPPVHPKTPASTSLQLQARASGQG